jgi:hypothetical protein
MDVSWGGFPLLELCASGPANQSDSGERVPAKLVPASPTCAGHRPVSFPDGRDVQLWWRSC